MDSLPEVLPILAEVDLTVGEVDRADSVAVESVDMARHQKHMLALVTALDVLGAAYTAHGRWEEAARAFGEAASLARSMPYPYGEAQVVYHWGRMDQQRECLDQAQHRLETARVIFERFRSAL